VADHDDLAEWFAEQQAHKQKVRAGMLAFGIVAVPFCVLAAGVLFLLLPQPTAIAPATETRPSGQTETPTEHRTTHYTPPDYARPQPKAAGELKVLKESLRARDTRLGGEITGTVVNGTDRRLRYVEIRFALFDKSGAQVGTTFTNTTDLDAGGRWNFRAITTGKDFETFRVVELSGH
jgi:hypothetical protein